MLSRHIRLPPVLELLGDSPLNAELSCIPETEMLRDVNAAAEFGTDGASVVTATTTHLKPRPLHLKPHPNNCSELQTDKLLRLPSSIAPRNSHWFPIILLKAKRRVAVTSAASAAAAAVAVAVAVIYNQGKG